MRSGFASLNVSSFNTYIFLPDYISSTIFSSISLLFILLASKEQFITVGSFWRRQDNYTRVSHVLLESLCEFHKYPVELGKNNTILTIGN